MILLQTDINQFIYVIIILKVFIMRNIEFNIQKQIFEWANMSIRKYPELKLLNASLNGVKLTSKVAGARAKQSGMKKGFPDLFLPVARKGHHGLFIELK